jgi:hypothetical protein
MKTTLLIVASVSLTACSFAARSPEQYRDVTRAALETKNDAIHACYDNVLRASPGVQGRVTVKFEVETEQGKITNVSVDKANTTAPDPVAECVVKNIGGLAIAPPPDANTGEASWAYEFAAPPPPAPQPKI